MCHVGVAASAAVLATGLALALTRATMRAPATTPASASAPAVPTWASRPDTVRMIFIIHLRNDVRLHATFPVSWHAGSCW